MISSLSGQEVVTSNADVRLTCDGCRQTATMVNKGTGDYGSWQIPKGWLYVVESREGEGQAVEWLYCSHKCLIDVECDN